MTRKRGPYKTYLSNPTKRVPQRTTYDSRKREQSRQHAESSNISPVRTAVDVLDTDCSAVEDSMNAGPSVRVILMPDDTSDVTPGPETSLCESGDESADDSLNDNCGESGMSGDESDFPLPPTFAEPLYKDAALTLQQAVFLVLAFVLKTGISQKQIEILLELLALLLPVGSLFPKTRHHFEKFTRSTDYVKVLLCPRCQHVLEDIPSDYNPSADATVFCKYCHLSLFVCDLVKQGNFFLHFPLERQLRFVLQELNLGNLLEHRFTRPESGSGDLNDIYDGRLYRTFQDGRLLHDKAAITLSANTDGAPLFKSSTKSFWPLYSIVNELPPEIRKKHIIVHSIWCCDTKPDFHSFLSYFTRELAALGEKGFYWLQRGARILSTVHLLAFGCDSPARAQVQNSKQFNGVLGCSWCTSPGIGSDVSAGKRVYPYEHPLTLRNNSETRQEGEEALRTGNIIQGIKGPSCLASLKYFDVVKGFVVDAMHCVDLGVVRQLINKIWLNSAHSDKPYYLGSPSTRQKINAGLKEIKVPTSLSRPPGSINETAHWKASEFRNFLLFYFPVLEGILPRKYFNHFALLSQAVYIFTKPCTREAHYRASVMLRQFVHEFETFYGLEHMSFNVHQLLHIPACVTYWGPLWVYENYAFEDANGKLQKLFNGYRYISEQMFGNIGSAQFLRQQAAAMERLSPEVSQLILQIMSKCHFTKNCFVLGGATFPGSPVQEVLSEERRLLIETTLQISVSPLWQSYERMIFRQNIFTVKSYSRGCRRTDCVLKLKNGTVCRVVAIAIVTSVTGERFVVLLGEKLSCVHLPYLSLSRHISVVQDTPQQTPFEIFSPSQIESKTCLIALQKSTYFPHLPHLWLS